MDRSRFRFTAVLEQQQADDEGERGGEGEESERPGQQESFLQGAGLPS